MNINRASIIIKTDTRNELRENGKKAQTYDDIVKELLKIKRESFNAAT